MASLCFRGSIADDWRAGSEEGDTSKRSRLRKFLSLLHVQTFLYMQSKQLREH